ncbi:hypothetical protein R1sor_007506 [Riccia sorocarpa]|uniref:Uncharacterized protein n=1 Tax=Riccia sorocarpa TaxID=122646 RepID=A0ABD3HQN1_9MARC
MHRFVREELSGRSETANVGDSSRKRQNDRRISLIRRSLGLEDFTKRHCSNKGLQPEMTDGSTSTARGRGSTSRSPALNTNSKATWRKLFGDSPSGSTDRERLHIRSNQIFERSPTQRSEHQGTSNTSKTPRYQPVASSAPDSQPQWRERPADQRSRIISVQPCTQNGAVRWGDQVVDDWTVPTEPATFSQSGESENAEDDGNEEEHEWKENVMEEVTLAFRQLPNRTSTPQDDDVEVNHVFDFDAQIQIQIEKHRWEDCGVVFCRVDMSPSRNAFLQWLYQEVENKAAVRIQHVKILAPKHYLVAMRSIEDRDGCSYQRTLLPAT